MRALIQRVSQASVSVGEERLGLIQQGLLVMVGVKTDDTLQDALYLARKVANLRVFEDSQGKMNLAIKDVGGAILSISQFTLYGDANDGNRPSFTNAAKGEMALPLFESFNRSLWEEHAIHVETGRFGADMQVSLINSGPVTLLLESRK